MRSIVLLACITAFASTNPKDSITCHSHQGPIVCRNDTNLGPTGTLVACLATSDHRRMTFGCYPHQPINKDQCKDVCVLRKQQSSFCCCYLNGCTAPEKIHWL